MSKLPKIDIIQCDETLDEVATKAYARRMYRMLEEDAPEILTRMEMGERLTNDEASLKGKNVLILLPSREFHKYLDDIIIAAGILHVSGMGITLGAIDGNNIPWFLPNCSIENLDWLNDLMKELEHAKCMNERYKQSIVGRFKKFPVGTLQWGLSQQFQNQHATYLNSLDVAVTSFIEDDLNTSIITLPWTPVDEEHPAYAVARSEYIYNLHDKIDPLLTDGLDIDVQESNLKDLLSTYVPNKDYMRVTSDGLSVVARNDVILLLPATTSVLRAVVEQRKIIYPLMGYAKTIHLVVMGTGKSEFPERAEFMTIDEAGADQLEVLWGMLDLGGEWDNEMKTRFTKEFIQGFPASGHILTPK